MATAGPGEFSVVDINDDQPKKGWCTVLLCDGDIKKKTSKVSVEKKSATSIHILVHLSPDKGRSLQFKVNHLPSEIVESSVEVKLSDGKAALKMKKREAGKSWAAYASDNLECDG